MVDDLVEAIVTGSLRPGDRLPPVSELSLRFGVSRTVLRESLKRVEEKGLISAAQGRRTTINPSSSWRVLDPAVLSAMIDHDDSLGVLDDLAVLRGSLESSMASSAANRRTAERDDDLRAAFDESARMIGGRDIHDDADSAFHATIREQSGNRLAANITRLVLARPGGRITATSDADAVPRTIAEHRVVLEAILAGDADAAATAMRDHIANAWDRRRPVRPSGRASLTP